jgi:hypothetical protein
LNIFFFTSSTGPVGPWLMIFQFHDHFTDSRTPWTSGQLVTRPVPKHRITQTRNKRIHTPNIHALCGIRTHDPGFRARSEQTVGVLPFLVFRGVVLVTSMITLTNGISASYGGRQLLILFPCQLDLVLRFSNCSLLRVSPPTCMFLLRECLLQYAFANRAILYLLRYDSVFASA